MGELWRKSAGELARLIRDGQVSSVEVMQDHLDRITAVNGALNAVTVVLEDALTNARAADARTPAGPLHGVPFTIKENIDLLGTATTHGVPGFVDALPTMDAPAVERMRAAGAIPLARTNMPEMGLRISTDNPLRGRTNNPWHPGLCAGGSSGGEGSALAAGMTPFGLGNDLGGSLRNPAFCNGICALKPTAGRIPGAGSIPPADPGLANQLMATDGPMARRVADLKLGLEVLNGRHVRDPRSVDVAIDGHPVPRTAALVTDIPMPADFVGVIRAAGAALEDAGYEVTEVSPPDLDTAVAAWKSLVYFGVARDRPILVQLMTPEAVELFDQAFSPPPMPIETAFLERRRLQREWSTFFLDHSVLIGPSWCDEQFPHNADIDVQTGAETTLRRLPFVVPGNLLGIPATALPAGLSAVGLPLGVQVYADLWRDDLTLAAGEILEEAFGVLAPIDPVQQVS